MKVGIVGSEGKKFTTLGESRAKEAIAEILRDPKITHVVSGACHLGGIDIWAEEIGDILGLEKSIFPPRELNWSNGFKPRNLQIAKTSDIIYCLTVDSLPPDYKGMRFESCYHCLKSLNGYKLPHIKSGGCWTVLQGIKMGKEGRWIVISNV